MNEIYVLDGRPLHLTNLDKILWPKARVTKGQLISYYLAISPYMLPHLADRLITLIRYPDGVEGKSFYQKKRPNYTPDWIPSHPFQGIDYLLVAERAALVYLANIGALEIHTSFQKIPENEPSEMVIDLDPSVEGFGRVVEAALLIKEELDALRLPSWVKTSGATGLQIFIPLKKGHTFQQTRAFLTFFARYMTGKRPDLITIERRVHLRGRKVYFDYLQHWRGKSLIAAYSTRARPHPTVSTPLRWQELSGLRPEDFTIDAVTERVRRIGDPFSLMMRGEGVDLAPYLHEIGFALH